MLNNQIAEASVLINASPEKVWKGLTTPEIIKDYLFGTETVTDWQPGNPIVFQGEYDGKTYKDHGTILTNEPMKKLEYSYWSGFTGLTDEPDNYSTVTYTLEKVSDTQTNFTWSQKGFANEDAFNHSNKGMAEFLQKIKETIENVKPS